jgi:hypothetical protein
MSETERSVHKRKKELKDLEMTNPNKPLDRSSCVFKAFFAGVVHISCPDDSRS